VDWELLQRQWDAQQEAYMPDREHRFAAMLDVVEATWGQAPRGHAPRVLDLAAGTGSITRRFLSRFPEGSSVVVDIDPALLAIARGTFDGDARVRVVAADLATPAWRDSVQAHVEAGFDAVLTATALHWLPADRVAALYREIVPLLIPGGLLANSDHIPDPGLADALTPALDAYTEERTRQLRLGTGALEWEAWWDHLAAAPELADGVAQRNAHFAFRAAHGHRESTMPADWHVAALRQAGFAHAGLVWRGLGDAVVVGLTSA
jgi:SAM-dependent methyltransferase